MKDTVEVKIERIKNISATCTMERFYFERFKDEIKPSIENDLVHQVAKGIIEKLLEFNKVKVTYDADFVYYKLSIDVIVPK